MNVRISFRVRGCRESGQANKKPSLPAEYDDKPIANLPFDCIVVAVMRYVGPSIPSHRAPKLSRFQILMSSCGELRPHDGQLENAPAFIPSQYTQVTTTFARRHPALTYNVLVTAPRRPRTANSRGFECRRSADSVPTTATSKMC